MNYLISQPFYASETKQNITCIWDHPQLGPIRFTATPDDPGSAYGPEIYANCVAGEYGPVVSYEDSHWYSLTDNNVWKNRTYSLGQLMVSSTGEQPPNSTNKPIPSPNPQNANAN